jgi:hypothetical protein
MALRTGHGNGAGSPRIEVLPVDEQPAPVAAPVAPPAVPLVFRPDGRIGDSATAKALGAKGGHEKARKVRLVDSLGLSKLVKATEFGPYRDAAEEFVSYHLLALAQQAGGEVGPAPSTMVASAGLQLAASRWAFDQGASKNDASLIKLGSSLANDSRQNLLAAYELAVREAKARADVDAKSETREQKAERILGPVVEVPDEPDDEEVLP